MTAKDLEGFSPEELRQFDELRIRHFLRLESENAVLRAQVVRLIAEVTALTGRLTAHAEAVARVRELGDTPWVAAARERKGI
jgi:hypothetical protein